MADTEYKRLIQAAKDRALFGYLAVVQRAMQDADKSIVDLLSEAKSAIDRSTLTAVRHFLRQDGNVFLRRVDMLFRAGLERAMQTMYVDLRPGMRQVSADELSLIDDEVVTHQIEVGRLAQRMRDANEESIGRLNVIIARLHGQHEAKERENPFRPYLLARTLYDAIKETVDDEAKAKVLFEHLSTTLAHHLPGYYNAIREVFESSGVVGKFQAQRSRAAHNQRYFGAPVSDPAMSAQLSARVMPGLQRVLETLQSSQGGAAAGAASFGAGGQAEAPGAAAPGAAAPPSVQEFIRTMFSPARSPGARSDEERRAAAHANPLVAQLDAFQKKAVAGGGADAGTALRDRMDLSKASTMDRMTVDVVSMLFEFILEDDHVPAALRAQIARLQIPMLKAAVMEPALMHDEEHPARRLLNRMSTAAVAADPASAAGKKLAAEIERVVNKVLADFDTDSAVFEDSVREFDQFMSDFLRQDDAKVSRGIEAVEDAERFSVLLGNAARDLMDVLLPLNADKRISDFLIMLWPHVLVRAAWLDQQAGLGPDHAQSLYRQFHAALPELLWSVQDKTAQDRGALMRLLPDLVRRIRKALEIIQLPEEEAKGILDLLMEMHTQVLRGAPKAGAPAPAALDDLRQQFARLVVHWERASWNQAEPPPPREDLIEEILGGKAVGAELHFGLNMPAASAADREFLAQTYLLGTRVAFRAADGSNRAGQLVWISTHRSLYLFRQERGAALAIYTPASLLAALQAEEIVPVEYAPVFERAVESLLFGAGSLQ